MDRYKVTGSHAVFGHEPGEVFDRDIPDAQKDRLLESGAITESRAQKPSPDTHDHPKEGV